VSDPRRRTGNPQDGVGRTDTSGKMCECGAVIYAPPVMPDCRVLAGQLHV